VRLQGDSVAVVDGLIVRNTGARQRSLAAFHNKTQLALLKFEHVDIQYIPRSELLLLVTYLHAHAQKR
jgi:hypothetical protein